MNRFLATLISNALAILVIPHIFSSAYVANLGSALSAALVLGLVNALIRPIMVILALPITLLTFGLFAFVINGAVLKIVSGIVPGFKIGGWVNAVLGALVLSFISNFIQKIIA